MPPRSARGEIVAEVMVRLTAEDFGVLHSIQQPDEPRAHVYLRVAREAVMPPTILVRYRRAPLFPKWLVMGPLSPLTADFRGRALLRQGWEVEAEEVAPKPPAPLHPDDLIEEEEEPDDE